MFVDSVLDLTAGVRKLLLTYNGYRSHMSLRVLELFDKNDIISYALLAHTSSKTQLLDVVLFRSFKTAFNESLYKISHFSHIDLLDTFDFCTLLNNAYNSTFTRAKIFESFQSADLWPLCPSSLIGVPRPRSDADIGTVISVSELRAFMEQKRGQARDSILGHDVAFTAAGFVDTKYGAVLKSAAAMAVARGKASLDDQRRIQEKLQAERKALAAARREHRERMVISRAERAKWVTRARLCNKTVDELRASVCSLKEGRAVTKLRSNLRLAYSVLPPPQHST